MFDATRHTSRSDRATYYPLTPQEVATLRQLRLSSAAFTLLLFIKTITPYGNKVMFTDDLNPKAIQQDLEMDRVTFWRAKVELLGRQLIEFNDHYIRDCCTVDRSQFKQRRNDEVAAANVSALPVAPDFRSLTAVANPQPSFQNRNDRASEPNQGGGFGSRKSLKTRSNLKTTRHSESVPTHHPVVSPVRSAIEETASSQDGGSSSSTVCSSLPAPRPRKAPKTSGEDTVSPGVFADLKEKLTAIGVSFNRNLLREFHQAGFERVQQAIDYINRKLAEAPGSIKRVAGYLVELLRNGENLIADTVEDTNAVNRKALVKWLDWAYDKQRGNILEWSCSSTGTAHFRSGEVLPFAEAMAKYPIPQ